MRESLQQIRQTALTAAGITRQLLDFARTGAVEQVLHNLVTNARDALPNGGALSVDVRGKGLTVTVTVLDTGSGIVRQSEGTIRVESAIGRGTSFVLQFPCADR